MLSILLRTRGSKASSDMNETESFSLLHLLDETPRSQVAEPVPVPTPIIHRFPYCTPRQSLLPEWKKKDLRINTLSEITPSSKKTIELRA